MIVAESQRARRLVGRLDKGSELLESIALVCKTKHVLSATWRAYGIVEEVELREFDTRARALHPPRRFAGPLTVVTLDGHVSELGGAPKIEAACALSREGENGIVVVGGRLGRARVFAVEFVIDCFDDVLLRAAPDAATGLPLWHEAIEAPREPAPRAGSESKSAASSSAESTHDAPTPAAHAPAPATAHIEAVVAAPARSAPAPAAPVPKPAAPSLDFEARAVGHVVSRVPPPHEDEHAGEPTWAEVAARSAQQGPPGEDDADDEGLRQGDVIEHPRFGRVEVERLEGAGEYAQVRLRNNRLVRLSLDVLQLARDGRDERGRRRFRARVST